MKILSVYFYVIQSIAYFLSVQYLDKTAKIILGLYGTSFLGLALTSLMVYSFPPFPKSIIIIIIEYVLIGGSFLQCLLLL